MTSSSLVETAYVCGIDAEWEPGLAAASATLLQLAFATCQLHKQSSSTVLLLDLMALPQAAVKDFLQSLLRNTSILKVGYGLLHDLWAIAAALGDEGLGCVSVVEPQLDVGTLHRQLHSAHTPGVKKVAGKGLSALTEAQLGMALDKTLQCSSWGSRPLTQAQIEYAALDAVCLLMLLDNIMACAPPHINAHSAEPAAEPKSDARSKPNSLRAPATCPQQGSQQQQNAEPPRNQSPDLLEPTQADSTATAGSDYSARPLHVTGTASGTGDPGAETESGFENSSSSNRNRSPQQLPDEKLRSNKVAAHAASGSNSSEHPLDDEQPSKTPAARQGRSKPAGAAAGGVQQPVRVIQPMDQQEPSSGTQQTSSEQSKTNQAKQHGLSQHQAAIQEAVEHWACRLEMLGAGKARKTKARRHLSRRQRAHIRHAVEQQNQIDEAAGVPVYVPWHAHKGEPRFICDVMTEGLAKQLRLYGVDAAAVQSKGKGSRHLVYRQMVDIAQAEERVILTCDRTFIRMGYSDQAFYVRTTNKQEQVREVLAHFNILIREDSLLSRCAKCNGTFFPRPILAEELPPNVSDVPQHIKELHKEFWVCQRCGQAYWQGSQYGNALQQLSQRLSGLTV